MADENTPAFYPRVGNIKAKNFKSAQPMPFIDDPRAMELPRFGEDSDQFGRVDVGVASQQNLELGRRMVERENQLRRQREADRSPLEKLAGGVQAGRFLGSALTQAINSAPTRLFKGDEAADKFMEERLYKPEQPLAYEYAQDVGDFLGRIETDYKIPPILPEAVALQYLTGPATAQAARAAGKGAVKAGMELERRMEPVVKGALERGGLPREMVMAMGANTQSNVVKPYGGNWLGGGEQLGIPENDLRRLKSFTQADNDPAEALRQVRERYTPEVIETLPEDSKQHAINVIAGLEKDVAVNKWIDSNLKNYVKKEMGTRDDPVRKLAEEGIIHTPLPEDLDRMEYLQAIRKAEGYPAEGMGKSELAKRWENLTDDSIRVTKAGKIQEAADVSERVTQARAEIDAYTKELDKNFLERMKDHTGSDIFSLKEVEALTRMPEIQKAEILGDTKYKELKENLYQLLAREQGFEKRAGELNPFVSKLDPETRLYSGGVYNLGFDHIVDVLKEDLGTGRIRPEQLNKISMEQAVRRTYEYDQELAKKMDAARLTERADLPVYKEYPEKGYKWVQLTRPGDFAAESNAMGHSARGYEPPQGHPDWVKGSGEEGYSSYGLGGWEAIKSGEAKVYSLLDSKGEPHVTIEVGKGKHPIGITGDGNNFPYGLRYGDHNNNYLEIPEEKQLEIYNLGKKLHFEDPNAYAENRILSGAKAPNLMDSFQKAADMLLGEKPGYVKQIKGKGNDRPISKYDPYTQDFVKSGGWSDVRDLQNTGLINVDGRYFTEPELIEAAKKYGRMGVQDTPWEVARQRHIDAGISEEDALANWVEAFKDGRGRLDIPPDVAPPAGMKRGGKVSISNNPDTMMMELGNQKFGIGGLAKVTKAAKNIAEPMKASEALGKIEGRPLKITQSDRTKVGGGYLGGPGFSSLQLTEPEYRAAEAAWGVQNAGTAKTILGGGKKGDNAVYAAMIGTPTQHQSNQMVFDKLYGDFKKAAKRGELTPELRDLINTRLAASVDKKGNPVFPADVDIMDKNFRDIADTFSRRSIAGHLMGGVQVGGKKGQIIDYDKIIRSTTDPALIDQPTGALGNRLFTLSGGIVDRPDLHPAFPAILQGEDLGLTFTPVERNLVMKDFVDKTMREKGRMPGYMDYTRGNPPTQLITEDILTEMQKLGLKKGGVVKKEGGYLKKPAAYINGDEFVNAAKKYGIKDSMNNLNKIVDLVNKGLSVDDAAQQVADSGMHKAAGGAISGDDLILEERPL